MKKFPNKKYYNLENYFNDYSNENLYIISETNTKELINIKKSLKRKYLSKSNIFVCGNGGSAMTLIILNVTIRKFYQNKK